MTAINRRHLLAGGTAVSAFFALGRQSFAQDTLPPVPTPEQWAKSPEINEIALSPDGTQIAYIREDEGTKLLYHYDSRAKAFQTFNIGVDEIDIFKWIDNEHLAVTLHKAIARSAYLGLRNKHYYAAVYNMTKKSVISPFDSNGTQWAGEMARITYNGKPHILSSCYDHQERQLLIRFAPDSTHFDIIDVGGYEVSNWVTTPEGQPVGRAEYYVEKKTWTLNYYIQGRWKEIYTHKGELDRPSLLGLGRDGASLVVYLEKDGDGGQFYEVDQNGIFSAPLSAPGISRSALFDPLTFRLCGFATFDGWFTYHYFDPVRQSLVVKAQKAVEGYRMSIAEQADDPNKMIVYTEGDDDAGTYYLIDFKTGATLTIGELFPQIPMEWISSKKSIKYKAADGLDIEAYLTLPPNREAKNLPLVMLPHGGPASRDDFSFDREVQVYASRGYAVLQPNFRGSSGYGESFERAGDGQVGRKMQTDLSDGVRHLVGDGLVDPKRVCIIGTSYGGYAAFAGATLDTGIYNCAVAIAGLSDTVKWLAAERGFLAEVISPAYTYTKRLLGDDMKLEEISPIRHISAVTIPILIMHGQDDSVVPITQSTDMYKALKAAGKDVTYLQVEHAEHGATTEASRTQMLRPRWLSSKSTIPLTKSQPEAALQTLFSDDTSWDTKL